MLSIIISQFEDFVCQGKDIYKIKITVDGVETLKPNGTTKEKLSEVSSDGEDMEVLEGVFMKPVGKKLPVKFYNNTGKVCLLSIMGPLPFLEMKNIL